MSIDRGLFDVVVDDGIKWFAVVLSDGGKLLAGYVLAQQVLLRKGFSILPCPLAFVNAKNLSAVAKELDAIIKVVIK